jgi:RNA polymerase sigma-70 factor (ECF subfamily)
MPPQTELSAPRASWDRPHARSAGSSARFRAQRIASTPESERRVLAAVNAAKAGDRDAMQFLYREYSGAVYGYVLSMVRDEHEAEDLTQHVFLKMLSRLDRYEAGNAAFGAWVLRVARNATLDHLRAKRPLPCEEVIGADERADVVHEDRRRSLQEALGDLPVDQRNVVMLSHLVGLSASEIGARMGRTDAAVHGLHHRARVALRARLAGLDSAPAVLCAG